MARSKTLKKGAIMNIASAAVGMYAGNAAADAVAQSDIGQNYPMAEGAIPAFAGVVLATSAKDARMQYAGAGMAAAGIVKLFDTVATKLNAPSNGFSRVNYSTSSPQEVANSLFRSKMAGRGPGSGRRMKFQRQVGPVGGRKARFKSKVRKPGVGFYRPGRDC